MAVHRSLPVSLPTSSTASINTESNLTVTVRQNGEVFFDKKKVSLDELQVILQEKIQKAVDTKSIQVELFADKALSYQELYRVLDIIRTAGVSNVSLQTGTNK